MAVPSRRRCALLSICVVLLWLLVWNRQGSLPSMSSPEQLLIAIEVSGAARGDEALRRFSSSLLEYFILPERRRASFDMFLWLQDDAAEELLHSLLTAKRGAVRHCTSRRRAMLQLRTGPFDEASDIATDHPSADFGNAWRADMSFNTLRMLHKLRGAAWLRLHASGDAKYIWVLRIRPDIELQTLLPLPVVRPPPRVALVPWRCHSESLLTDQLLLLSAIDTDSGAATGAGGSAAAVTSATMLGPIGDMWQQVRQLSSASQPPTLYPERLVWHALRHWDVRQWLPESELSFVLVGPGSDTRDPLAKLRADYPRCFGVESS